MDVGSSVQQQSHNLIVTIVGSHSQGSHSIIALMIDNVPPSIQCASDCLYVTISGSPKQGFE
jgi:hypothetical protein